MNKKANVKPPQTLEGKMITVIKKCTEEYGRVYTLGLLQLMINIVQQEINEEVQEMMMEAEDE